MSDYEVERIQAGLVESAGRLPEFRATEGVQSGAISFVSRRRRSSQKDEGTSSASDDIELASFREYRQRADTEPSPKTVKRTRRRAASLITIVNTISIALAIVAALATFSAIGGYAYYTLNVKTRWHETLRLKREKAENFAFKCDVLASEARWLADLDQLWFLHDVGCPGVPPQMNQGSSSIKQPRLDRKTMLTQPEGREPTP